MCGLNTQAPGGLPSLWEVKEEALNSIRDCWVHMRAGMCEQAAGWQRDDRETTSPR